MSGPITFLPTPHASATQTADAQSSWQAVASTTDQNFSLINSWLINGHGWPAVWTSRLSAQYDPPVSDSWDDFGSLWPSVSFPVPANCRGLWVIVSAQLETNPAKLDYVAVGAQMSGSGFLSLAVPEWTEVSCSGSRIGISRWLLWPASVLAVGQTCTLTPVFRQTGGPTPINAHITYGDLYAIVLT